ncbi:bifunctional DNA primase/polymerase [Streptomyces sp. NPDC086766]|uniref:bifunctional DNA primase/polymerase n=1 Tax=Streptomyces sp. NPDC086766 TaxID=3365754 RepID=UPI0038107C53
MSRIGSEPFFVQCDDRRRGATRVTADGAAWLASAGTYPRSTLAFWRERPDAPVVLPCGTSFDVVNAPATFGRRMLDRLWGEGPGSGPVAVHRGRMLLFAAPGTAQRLPSLLEWEEWGASGGREGGRVEDVPPLLCHGTGDAVTVPAPAPAPVRAGGTPAHHSAANGTPVPHAAVDAGPADDAPAGRPASRWLVAPDTRRPWLPGPEILLWAAVRAARSAVRISIFPPADQDAKVYDVSRRR